MLKKNTFPYFWANSRPACFEHIFHVSKLFVLNKLITIPCIVWKKPWFCANCFFWFWAPGWLNMWLLNFKVALKVAITSVSLKVVLIGVSLSVVLRSVSLQVVLTSVSLKVVPISVSLKVALISGSLKVTLMTWSGTPKLPQFPK